ncbi:unnamed protein product [Lactuca saligna]|uniref:Uncharacterized protein n=1 Tax=Lactuca saligna TaxID=75948 RepID=A0AA35YZE0_LACSI|nr:unnamed protein product [Lactuca saligna]
MFEDKVSILRYALQRAFQAAPNRLMTNNAYLALLGASDLLILACSHVVSIYTLVPGDRLDTGEKLIIGCRKATISAETQKGETEAVNGCKVGSIEATIERDREVSPEVWISRAFEADNGLNDNSEFTIENEDETVQAKCQRTSSR